MELAEIIDIPKIQSLMNDFYKLVHIPIRLNDLKGNVLIGVGWQDICTKFHWVNLKASKHCVESNTKLCVDVLPGEFRLYKCKNNMWDIVTPIMISRQHVGYIFAGQFFFDDESLDYELFRSQARKFGFNEEEYIAALEKVPRLSREAIDTGMSFFIAFADMLSQLSYSNTMLAKSLSERDALVAALQESEKREKARSEELAVVLDAAPAAVMIAHDPRAIKMTGNQLSYEWIRLPEGTNISKAFPEEKRPETHKLLKDGVEISPEDMPLRIAASGKEVRDYELDIAYPNGAIRHVLCNARPLRDEEGNPRRAVAALIDITERKKAEGKLRESEEKYRNIVETANEGIVTIDSEGKITYVNRKMADMIGYRFEEIIGRQAWDFIEPEAVNIVKSVVEKRPFGINESYEIKLNHKDGSLLWVLANVKSLFDEKGDIIGSLGMFTDITKKKNTENKLKETLDNLDKLVKERTADLEKAYNSLKESEKRLEEAQQTAHLGNWDWDLLTNEMYWSDEVYRIFGLTPYKLSSSFNDVLNCTHPDDREFVDNAVKRALKGEPFAIDHRLSPASGEERIVHAQGIVVFDARNKPVRMKGTVQDITERKKSEEEIRNLANIVESSNDAVGTISLDGNITSWNKGAEQVYGYSAEKILGRPSYILAPPRLREETKKLIERIKQGESIHHYETLRLRRDGKIINVSRTLSPIFDSHGNMTAISFISRDITERKRAEEKLRESEEKYRNIVETANEGIVKTDYESVITYVNNQLADMLGYSMEEVIGRTIWGFISDEYKPIIKLNLEKKKQGTSESGDLKLMHKDGSRIWIHMNSKPLFDREGKYIGAVSMITDITKRKEAEQALANFEIAREKEIHHRIKNNLQVVYSMLDFHAFKFKGRNDIKDSEVMDSFRESKNRVRSMALIHEELYKSSELETINFSAYVEKLASNLLSIYRLGNTDISLNRDMEENLFFDMDTAISLGTIINELVSNSLKYAFRGRDKGEIQIKMHREENRDYIRDIEEVNKSTTFVLTVSDNGVGIPENIDIEKLDSLGLQLVTSLAYKLGGELELNRNNGTEVNIRFIIIDNIRHQRN